MTRKHKSQANHWLEPAPCKKIIIASQSADPKYSADHNLQADVSHCLTRYTRKTTTKPWASTLKFNRFLEFSRYVFTQNVIKFHLSAAVYELLWPQCIMLQWRNKHLNVGGTWGVRCEEECPFPIVEGVWKEGCAVSVHIGERVRRRDCALSGVNFQILCVKMKCFGTIWHYILSNWVGFLGRHVPQWRLRLCNAKTLVIFASAGSRPNTIAVYNYVCVLAVQALWEAVCVARGTWQSRATDTQQDSVISRCRGHRGHLYHL